MSTNRKNILNCLKTSDLDQARDIFQSGELALQRPGFAGGTWLFYAAEVSCPEMLSLMVDLGFDPNVESESVGDRAICRAAYSCRHDNVQRLLSLGTILDASASARNPLFSAIIGGSADVVELMLNSGINTNVRYTSDTMVDMDATSFALWRGEKELALMIATHITNGAEKETRYLMKKAEAVSARNAALGPVRIVPTFGDLRDD